MGLIYKTKPTVEPVTVEELRLHSVIDDDAADSYLESLLASATQRAETITGRQLTTATYYWTLDRFAPVLYVPRPPLQSVEAITYATTAALMGTVDESYYSVAASDDPGRITLAYGCSWPWVYPRPGAVCIEFVAGYGDTADDVPADIRHAIRLLAGWWYEQREDVIVGHIVAEVPGGVTDLLLSYRITDAVCAPEN
jgi:uncharacterized phiE125 gp8 family phage protein